MATHKHTPDSRTFIIERLATFYFEAICKNPESSVYDNIERAVERLPVVHNAWELLEVLEESLEVIECEYLEKKSEFAHLEERMGGEAYEYAQYENMQDAKERFEKAQAVIAKARGEA